MTSVYPELGGDHDADDMPEHHPVEPTVGIPADDSHYPAPDTSANWGYDGSHAVTPTGGLDIGKATAPSDPMSFVPEASGPGGWGEPCNPATSWGYPDHGTEPAV